MNLKHGSCSSLTWGFVAFLLLSDFGNKISVYFGLSMEKSKRDCLC